jgi:hypothetical protein
MNELYVFYNFLIDEWETQSVKIAFPSFIYTKSTSPNNDMY